MHQETIKSISYSFLILFISITAILFVITGAGTLWYGFSAMACDPGCDTYGLLAAHLLSVFPYILVITAIIGWKTYHSQMYKLSLLSTWGVTIFWWVLITLLRHSNSLPQY